MPVAQRGARRGFGRLYLRTLRGVRSALRAALVGPSANDAVALDAAMAEALAVLGPHMACFPYSPPELAACRERRFALQERLDLDEVMRALKSSNDYEKVAECVRRVDRIRDTPGTPAQMELEREVRARLTQLAAAKIDPIASEAVAVLDKHLMQTVHDEAQRACYTSPDVARIAELLALSEEQLIKMQLKLANETDDPDRIVNREIRLKKHMLDVYASLFALETFAQLKDATEWAARKTFFQSASGKRKLAESFLLHSAAPIHLALTVPPIQAPKNYDKEAVLLNKCLLGWCGDTTQAYPEQLAAEALAKALYLDCLRVELYVQILKQLSRNPVQNSLEKGWQFLAAAFLSFPPPPQIENVVALFVRDKAPHAHPAPDSRNHTLPLCACFFLLFFPQEQKERERETVGESFFWRRDRERLAPPLRLSETSCSLSLSLSLSLVRCRARAPGGKRTTRRPALKDVLMAALYSAVYGGERKNPATAEQLPKLIAATFNSKVSARYLDNDVISSTAGTPPGGRNASKPPPSPQKSDASPKYQR